MINIDFEHIISLYNIIIVVNKGHYLIHNFFFLKKNYNIIYHITS